MTVVSLFWVLLTAQLSCKIRVSRDQSPTLENLKKGLVSFSQGIHKFINSPKYTKVAQEKLMGKDNTNLRNFTLKLNRVTGGQASTLLPRTDRHD